MCEAMRLKSASCQCPTYLPRSASSPGHGRCVPPGFRERWREAAQDGLFRTLVPAYRSG